MGVEYRRLSDRAKITLTMLFAVLACLYILSAGGCDFGSGEVVKETSEPNFLRGQEELRRGNISEALSAFLKVSEKRRDAPESHFELGRIYLEHMNDPNTALLGVAIAALWKQVPLTTLLLLSGLQNVPDDMLEAATIDGASRAKKFFAIVIPYMKSVISIVVSMAIIENFKQFPLIWTMTGGGPSESTTTLAVLSYREAFISNNLGSGAAVTTLWMLLMIVVVAVYRKLVQAEDMN